MHLDTHPTAPDRPAAPVSARTDRYMARVASHLEGLPKSERVPFLQRERVKWITRSEQFAAHIDAGGSPNSDETVDDYVLTIMALTSRITQEQRQEHMLGLVGSLMGAGR